MYILKIRGENILSNSSNPGAAFVATVHAGKVTLSAFFREDSTDRGSDDE